ncbi:hypothetical protein NKG94_50720 [Micromonospora sp. M12]
MAYVISATPASAATTTVNVNGSIVGRTFDGSVRSAAEAATPGC